MGALPYYLQNLPWKRNYIVKSVRWLIYNVRVFYILYQWWVVNKEQKKGND